MKTIDLTIFLDLKEEDLNRASQRQWTLIGDGNLIAKINEEQLKQLMRFTYPRWSDGRTRDGKEFKIFTKNLKKELMRIYETDYGTILFKII